MSRLPRLLGVFAVTSVLLLTAAAPAAAHDELVASSPAPGERLADAPSEIALSFSSDVLTMGAAVIVADADGRDWVIGDPIVEAGTVTVPVDGSMPDAGYEVRWRVVSSDGHPISGLIPFTVGGGSPLVRTTDEPSPQATSPAGATSGGAASDQNQSTPQDQHATRVVLVGAAGAAIAVALFALVSLLRRRGASARTDGTGETVE